MTERTHGFVLGKFTAGFIGLVAMAALVTGAVAAANAHSPSVTVADATATPKVTTAEEASESPKVEITENPSSEASEHPSDRPESGSSASPKPGASCNPSLDNKEDVAEGKAREQPGAGDDRSPNPSASPEAVRTPEPSEPPSCLKADPDSHGDQKSGKTDAPPVGGNGDDGPGHSGLHGTFAPDLFSRSH
jgi:hypothetical protein